MQPDRAGGVIGTCGLTSGLGSAGVSDGDGGEGGGSDNGGSDDDGVGSRGGVTQPQDEYACSPSPYPTHEICSSDGQAVLLQSDFALHVPGLPEEPGPGNSV